MSCLYQQFCRPIQRNERPQLAIRDAESGSPEESLLVYLIRSSRPAAAFAGFCAATVSPKPSSPLRAIPSQPPARRFPQRQNTLAHLAPACPGETGASRRLTPKCHVLGLLGGSMLPWYLAAPVNAGSSAKRIFPVLLLRIDSLAYRFSLRLPMDSPTPTDETNQLNQRTELSAKSPAVPSNRDRN